jgi:UDP-N-acetylglucosamine acyltransferase
MTAEMMDRDASATEIHLTAVIEAGAELGAGVVIGPYAFVGAGVRLGDRCRVDHHASLRGPSAFGPDNHFFPFCAIGDKTQDLKYTVEPTHLEVGSGNIFREFVTVNRATSPGGRTILGSHNTFLAYSHIAHDCVVGNRTVFSNNGTLAGHVTVGDYAVIGGLSAVHQFCRIGAHAIVGGCSKIVQDVPPYFIADGNPAKIRGVNAIGLERAGFAEEDAKVLRRAFKILYDSGLNTSQALERLEAELGHSAHARVLIEFVRASQRGIIR